jgi:L-fucose mutarotase
MEVVGDAAAIPEICQEFATLVGQAAGRAVKLAAIERFAFYQRARDAFAIIATGEMRLYGNLLLRKGVIRPT